MSLFQFPQQDVVTSYSLVEGDSPTGARRVGRPRQENELRLMADSGAQVELADQFLVFQLNNELKGPTILECSKVEPKITGSADEPDVLVALEMLSFHIGSNEGIEADTRATMRINFGKDQSSTNKHMETLFWSIAAGLQLYDSYKNKRSESKDLRGDFPKAFGNRPIEIPGGLGQLSFQVIKHTEPPWWRKVLGFAQSETSRQLVSVLGFPAITTQAIGVIDELLGRLEDSKPEVLFGSMPMRLALSQWARDEFSGGNSRVRIGSLRPGFCVLTRGRDYDAIAQSNALYYPQYGRLVPADVSASTLMSGTDADPLKHLTYAVLRVAMKSTKLDPTFNFTG